jgi:Cas6b C-terminal domain/Cas6b N-terminal domain
MKNIRYLRISFEVDISLEELPKFRGAIVAAVSLDNQLFHNHDGEQFRYAYPLIQYKRQHGKAVIVCLAQGTDEIHALFATGNKQIQLGDRTVDLRIENMSLRDYTFSLMPTDQTYHLNRWLALQGDKHKEYQTYTSDTDRRSLLESVLRGNILSMAKGLDWFIDGRVEVKILEFQAGSPILHKDTAMTPFAIRFSCNVSMPDAIGIGKGAARGFGVLGRVKVRNEASLG